jgi:hypothetical protein
MTVLRCDAEWIAVALLECSSRHAPAQRRPDARRRAYAPGTSRKSAESSRRRSSGLLPEIERVLAWLSSVARLFLLGATPSSSRYILPPRAIRHFLEP